LLYLVSNNINQIPIILIGDKIHTSEDYPISWNLFKWGFLISVFFGVFIDFFTSYYINHPARFFILIITITTIIGMLILEIKYMWDLPDHEPQQMSNNAWNSIKDDLIISYYHANRMYHQRVNFFLVAESMLVVSFITSITNLVTGLENIKFVRVVIALLGLIFTISWFYVNKRLDWRLTYLNTNYMKKFRIYENYLDSVGRHTLHSGLFMSNILPATTFFFWYFLAYLVWHNIL
jgi:hypothetical protein